MEEIESQKKKKKKNEMEEIIFNIWVYMLMR